MTLSAIIRACPLVLAVLLAVTAVASADERAAVRVLITPQAAGARAHFAFDHPVRSFEMDYEFREVRDKTWKLSAAFVRDGVIVSRSDGAAFSQFDVDIEAFNEPTDAIYPCVFRVGAEGIGLYAAYFAGADATYATTVEIAPPAQHVVVGLPGGGNTWAVDRAFQQSAGHRYVYVGPSRYVTESRYARFAIPPETLAELAAEIRADADRIIAFYSAQTAHTLAAKPLIMLAANPALKISRVQGDTTYGPAVALRLFGADLAAKFDPKSRTISHLISHEAAHFWNADTFHPVEGSPAWLWEGGAEYWSALAQETALRGTAKDRIASIELALNRCIETLLGGSLGTKRSSGTYVCGQTLQWLADTFERTRSKGRRNIFALWRRLFGLADNNGGVYSVETFIAAAVTSEAEGRAFTLFLGEDGTERWSKLPALLAPFGVELTAGPPDPEIVRTAALMHLLDMNCSGTRGMWHDSDHLKLDTGERCGPLNGDPEVDAINGHNLFTDPAGAYEAVTTACAANSSVVLTRTGVSDERTMTCTAPLPPLPPTFKIAGS